MGSYTQPTGDVLDFTAEQYTQTTGDVLNFNISAVKNRITSYNYVPLEASATATSNSTAETTSYVFDVNTAVTFPVTSATAEVTAYSFTPSIADVTTKYLAKGNITSYSFETNNALGVIDDILVIVVPDNVTSLKFNADEIGDEMVQPLGQNNFVPFFQITNQTDTQQTVQVKWDSSLNGTLDVGLSTQPEDDYADTIDTSDIYTDLVTLESGERQRVWAYTNFVNNSFGQLLNNDLRIEKK